MASNANKRQVLRIRRIIAAPDRVQIVFLPQAARCKLRPEALRSRESVSLLCVLVNYFFCYNFLRKRGAMANLTPVVRDLQKKRDQLQEQIGRLDSAINTLSGLNGRGGRGGRRNLSAAARQRIAAAQKARWAKWKKANKAA